MTEQIASPPAGGQGAAQVSPPAAPPAENNTSPPAAPPPPPAEAPKPFYSEFKNPELRGYAEKKGFPDAETLASSYMNLEKFHGVPAERLMKLPENIDDAEAIKPVLEKLGYVAPKEASEYGFADMEGADKTRAAAIAAIAHKHGVPAKMAQAVFKDLLAADLAEAEALEAQYNETVEIERGRLKADVGVANWDTYEEECKRAGRQFGLDEESIDKLANNIGLEKTYRFLNEVGKRLGEAPFIDGGQRKSEGMSPAAARAEITALKSDAAFFTRLMAKEQGAVDKWNRLNQIAASEQGAAQ